MEYSQEHHDSRSREFQWFLARGREQRSIDSQHRARARSATGRSSLPLPVVSEGEKKYVKQVYPGGRI